MSKHEIGDLLAHVRRPGKVPKSEYLEDGEFPVIDQGKLSVAGYTNNSEVVLHSPLPVVVFGDHTRAVKFAKVPFACGADGTQLLYPNTDKIDPTFFFYAVKNINLSNYFYARHFKFLKKQTIELPPHQSQIYIASILSAYDDLIENNQRRIQLLEQSARLLYKEWFVHLRFPGHEHTTITDGIPEGWERKPFSEVVDFKEGPGLRNYQYRDEGIPFLNIRTFNNDEIDLSETKCIEEMEVNSKYQHFLLEEDDHVISSSGTLGRLVTIRTCHLPVMLNTSLIRMRPKGIMKKWFLKAYLKYGDFIDQAHAIATGAAQLNYGPSHLKTMSIVMPTTQLVGLFEDRVAVNYRLIKFLLDSNLKLTEARDILLPCLMNGKWEMRNQIIDQ